MGQRTRILIAALLGFLAGACGREETQPARNVVLIVVDTLRADQTSLHGYARDTTPFLAEWAQRDGQVFERALSTAPWTKPSIASMLSGLMPQQHQLTLHMQKLPSDGPNVAEAFRSRGFQTAAIQSNHLLAHEFGYNRGFDAYVDGVDTTLATHDRSTGPAVNAAAFAWLDARDRSKPFFLYVHHYEPHHNYLRDGSSWFPGYRGPLTGAESMDELYGLVSKMSPDDIEFLRARYDAEIRYQDDLLRELVAGLRERGLLEDTAVVLTSDHGEEFAEHGDLSHQYKLYEELVHVPLLVVRPGERRRGARIAGVVSLVDLPRTLLDLCGQYAARFPGRSLVGLLEGIAEEPRACGGHASTIPPGTNALYEREMFVDGRWKLVLNRKPGTRELYDLVVDPREQSDLSTAQPDQLERMQRGFEAWKVAAEAGRLGALPANIQLTPELEERMRKLGYLGG
ncbi:MAG: sulfatase [Planctomycetes bacterium]|nr:sulfatase [Planctomycetota bacterium]